MYGTKKYSQFSSSEPIQKLSASNQIINDTNPKEEVGLKNVQIDREEQVGSQYAQKHMFPDVDTDEQSQPSKDNSTIYNTVETEHSKKNISVLSIEYPFCSLTVQKTFHISKVAILDLSNCHIIDWQGTDELLRLNPQYIIGIPRNLRMARIKNFQWFINWEEFINKFPAINGDIYNLARSGV